MELRGKRIILFSPEPWAGLHMSKHHLSQALAERGNAVVFVDPPAPANIGIRSAQHDGVTVVQYRHWLRGVNRLPRAVNQWYYRRLIQRIAAHTGGPFDIIWCFDTSRMQWFPEGVGFKLLSLADYDILYVGQGLIPTADIIFTTGQMVADTVARKTRARTINIGHALDERWMSGIDVLGARPSRKPHNVVFAGQLATRYNDWGGFAAITGRHPELRFTFIGPYDPAFPDPAFQALFIRENVTFTGLMTKDELVPTLRGADLLLFGFRTPLYSKERANPHKVLEYLSTGNVIVGSYTLEYKDRPDLFCMAPEGGDLSVAFDHALEQFADLDRPAARAARIDAVRDRSMTRLIERIEQEIIA